MNQPTTSWIARLVAGNELQQAADQLKATAVQLQAQERARVDLVLIGEGDGGSQLFAGRGGGAGGWWWGVLLRGRGGGGGGAEAGGWARARAGRRGNAFRSLGSVGGGGHDHLLVHPSGEAMDGMQREENEEGEEKGKDCCLRRQWSSCTSCRHSGSCA